MKNSNKEIINLDDFEKLEEVVAPCCLSRYIAKVSAYKRAAYQAQAYQAYQSQAYVATVPPGNYSAAATSIPSGYGY